MLKLSWKWKVPNFASLYFKRVWYLREHL